MVNLKSALIDDVTAAVKAVVQADVELELAELPTIVVERSDTPEHGEYASPVALSLARQWKKNPLEVAKTIAEHIEKKPYVDRVEVVQPGFINFFIAREFFAELVGAINAAGKTWGSNEVFAKQKVMVEYTNPNPFKPFHIGHLMSNAIGEAISRLVEFGGADVKRANYQGDVGLHVAKTLWGLEQLTLDPASIDDLGEAYVYGSTHYEDDEEAKAAIVAINKQVYEDDPGIQEAYQTGRRVSLEHFEELYQLLGTKFDFYFFESAAWKAGQQIVEDGLKEGVFEKAEGAVIFRGEPYGLHTRVFITGQGLPTYEAKELALVGIKQEAFDFDQAIVITAQEQAEYFKVVFKAFELLHPKERAKLKHVHHGMMKLADGKMSSRKGNIITGESLLRTMRERALAVVADRDLGDQKEAIANAVAVAAIKYSILKQSAGRDIVFDPTAALSFEGDSGPYLQYTHTRARSVLKRAAEKGVTANEEEVPPTATAVERLLDRWPEVVEQAQENFEPHTVAVYLAELAGAFNSWYAEEKIVDVDDPYSPYKVGVTKAVSITIKNGLWLLGITTPERM